MRSRASLFGLLAVAVALSAALSTRAVAMCMDGDCTICHPCNVESWCYDPCSNPSLWCYAPAGCGGPVCSECDPSSSCYDPCTLSCFDEATCGAGPTDPSPVVCDAFSEGPPPEGAQDLGFASVVEEDAPADTVTGSFSVCVDFPPSGQSRTLFAGTDNSAETSQGIASSAVRNYGLTSESMASPSLSAKDREDITKCVQREVNSAMGSSPNRITVTNTCPSAQSQQPFARVIVGNPSPGLAAKMSAANSADGVAAVLPDCRPRTNGVALVNSARGRNNRHRCETIVHEFFHTLGLVHVEDRPPDFQQDIMQHPAVAGQRYTATNGDLRTKSDNLPRCTDRQNTNKKVQQAIAVLVQPICPGHGCEADKGENCQTCPQDCGTCGGEGPICGDGICNGDETCETCPDCPPCGGGGGGGGGSGGGGVCCEFIPGSNCLFIPCGAGWRCINNSCFPGCVTDQDCAFLCSGPDGGLCQCRNGQCARTSSCVCDCTGPFCCPPGDPHCRDSGGSGGGGGGGGGGDPVWDWCFFDVCRGDFDCADACAEFFAQ